MLTNSSDLFPNLKEFGGATMESEELIQFMQFLQNELAMLPWWIRQIANR
jgi:hypothetical protein